MITIMEQGPLGTIVTHLALVIGLIDPSYKSTQQAHVWVSELVGFCHKKTSQGDVPEHQAAVTLRRTSS